MKRDVSSLRDFEIEWVLRYRGLKPPVNKVTSLRDFFRAVIERSRDVTSPAGLFNDFYLEKRIKKCQKRHINTATPP